MAFKAKPESMPTFGTAGIRQEDKNKYQVTLCTSVEPDDKLERGTGHYFCDIHMSKEQLKELIQAGQNILELLD